MPDYKALYFKLFAAMADANEILEKAMKEAEEMYINSCENATNKTTELKSDNTEV